MTALQRILKNNLQYYVRLERQLLRRLERLPQGSVKRRRIKGGVYYYLQRRHGNRVVHRYLGRRKPVNLISAIQERRVVRRELTKARAALRLLPKRRLGR